MAQLTIKELLEAGTHYGHQTKRWNPKMKRYIFEARNGLYIIDLAKTLQQIRNAVAFIEKIVLENKPILFVGTKKQAKGIVREVAEECGEHYVCERWLGGFLTNRETIRKSIKRLEQIEKAIAAGAEGLTKKEFSKLEKQQVKLEKNLSGIRSMRKLPGLVVVVDPGREHIAVAEANKLKIPLMGLVDTNCNPDPIQHVIACNDDALKSIKLVLKTLGDAIIQKKNEMLVLTAKDKEKEEEIVENKKGKGVKKTEEKNTTEISEETTNVQNTAKGGES